MTGQDLFPVPSEWAEKALLQSAGAGTRSEMVLQCSLGIALISRAAEGSVRDGLSILDQAIVQTDPGQIVPAKVVQDMLGLADRSQTIELFEQVMRG